MDAYLLGLKPPEHQTGRRISFGTAISPELEKLVRVQVPEVVAAILADLRKRPMTKPQLIESTGYKDHQLERALKSAKHDGLIVGKRVGLCVVYSVKESR